MKRLTSFLVGLAITAICVYLSLTESVCTGALILASATGGCLIGNAIGAEMGVVKWLKDIFKDGKK